MPSWDNDPNGSMTAAVLTSPGADPPSKCFSIEHSYPKPSVPGPEWVLVGVKAAGLNRAELRSRRGEKPGMPEFNIFQSEYHEDPPKILGEEFVGIIETAGDNTKFKPGDHVVGWVYGGGKAHDGAYAQYTICHSRRCFRLPSTSLDWDILGGIFMSMWTAWGSLFEAAQITPTSTVLIHGATSSVGLWAVLLAKNHRCTVFATTRKEEKVGRLKEAGADHVLLEDGLSENLRKMEPEGVDCILELVGPDSVLPFALQNLRMHGTVVVTGNLTGWGTGFGAYMIPSTRKVTFFTTTAEDEGLEKVPEVIEDVVRKVESGVYRKEVFLDKSFKLDEVGLAHQYMEEARAVGKVVLEIP